MNRDELVALKSREIKKEVQRELEGRIDIDDEEVLKLIDDKIRIKNKQVALLLSDKLSIRREVFNAMRRMDVLQELMDDGSVTGTKFTQRLLTDGTENDAVIISADGTARIRVGRVCQQAPVYLTATVDIGNRARVIAHALVLDIERFFSFILCVKDHVRLF